MNNTPISANFTLEEYLCKCGRPDCDAPKMPDADDIEALQNVRDDYGYPMVINSWARCAWYNEKIGGSEYSQHMVFAVDIKSTNSGLRWQLIEALIKNKFTVMVYSTWVHADRRPGIPLFMWGQK
jgi:hypothetical protein